MPTRPKPEDEENIRQQPEAADVASYVANSSDELLTRPAEEDNPFAVSSEDGQGDRDIDLDTEQMVVDPASPDSARRRRPTGGALPDPDAPERA
ncbi:MAG: hypothetical protein IT355_10500 [Gemmatimonadaceae bacterium]|nr:hypothetical protein [Gemmatimonadaceae bacterium]